MLPIMPASSTGDSARVTPSVASQAERKPDPDDGRGVIVFFTPKGRHALANAVEIMTSIEQDYAGIVGAKGLADLKRMLKAILDQKDRSGEFGLE